MKTKDRIVAGATLHDVDRIHVVARHGLASHGDELLHMSVPHRGPGQGRCSVITLRSAGRRADARRTKTR